MPDKKLLSRIDICFELNIGYEQLPYYIKKGLPHIGEGKTMMFDLEECHKWFAGGWIQTEKVKDGVLDCRLRKIKTRAMTT